jgi:hypothetical protein
LLLVFWLKLRELRRGSTSVLNRRAVGRRPHSHLPRPR